MNERCFLAIATADCIEPTVLEIVIGPRNQVMGSSELLTEVSKRHHIPRGYISFVRLDGLPYYAWSERAVSEDGWERQEHNFLHGLSGAPDVHACGWCTRIGCDCDTVFCTGCSDCVRTRVENEVKHPEVDRDVD